MAEEYRRDKPSKTCCYPEMTSVNAYIYYAYNELYNTKTMKLIFTIALLLGLESMSQGQINAQDSTVQVIGYWSIGETQSYVISNEKYKIKNTDTISQEIIKSEVDITIKDSTSNSYLIEWIYKDFQIQGDNKFIKKLMSISENIPILLRTDEFGTIQGVENWEQLRDEMSRSTEVLKVEFKDIPNIDLIISSVQELFQSKEIIETRGIDVVRQFYRYHGGAYKLGEQLNRVVKVTNIYGGEPFDANVTVILDEINVNDDNSIIRMSQTIPPKQIADAACQFMNKLLGAMDAPKIEREDLAKFENQIDSATRVHGTGWIIYSVQTKIIKGEGVLSFTETIIEIK